MGKAVAIDVKESDRVPVSRALVRLVKSWVAYALLPIVGIATAPILARALGPDGRGQLAGILQPMTIASAVAILGAPSAITYYIGAGAPAADVLRQAWRAAIVSTGLVGVALAFYATDVSRNLHVSRLLIFTVWAAFIPSAFVAIRRAELQARRVYSALDYERAGSAFLRLAAIAGLFALAIRHLGPYAIAYMASGLVGSAVLFSRRWPRIQPAQVGERFRERSAAGFHRFALLASLGTIAGAMNSRLDQAIMPANTSAIQLGYYSAAVAVAEAPMIVAAVVSRNVLAETSGGVGLRKVYQTIALGGAVVIIGCFALAFLLPILVPIAFGHDFAAAVAVTRILLISTVAQYFADGQSALLVGLRAPGLSSLASVIAVAATVILFVVFWGSMTAVKAAWISAVAQLISLAAGGTIATILVHRRSASAS